MVDLYDKILKKDEKVAVVGLGYVGLPLAVAFAEKVDVIGFDISEKKIKKYQDGIDPTREVGNQAIKKTTADFTADPNRLKEARFLIVAVPTPITADKIPDLESLKAATKTVGENMSKDSIVVFESTVYPGATGEICVPILEKASGLKYKEDFTVGFSPERVSPGDKEKTLKSIVKVVSGTDAKTLETIAKTYELIVEAGIYQAESIQVAEAAKVIENAQRDINIAFMNELSIIFDLMEIDTREVLNAAATKWNFKNYSPGLVGGHCIGVDPYYLTYKAEQFGYHPEILLAGRRMNDGMGKKIVENLVKLLLAANVNIKYAKVAILGFTFKENVPDIRNTRTIDIIDELETYGVTPMIHDSYADYEEVYEEYGLHFQNMEDIKEMDAVILTVGHDEYMEMTKEDFNQLFKERLDRQKVILDVKGILDREEMTNDRYSYWRL